MSAVIEAFPALPALKSLGDLSTIRPTIIVDTREQTPLAFTRLQFVKAIADHFGLDDSERNIDWQYASVPSRGHPGVIVTIEPL